MTGFGVGCKRRFYQGALLGRMASMAVAVIDWLLPTTSRLLLAMPKHRFPITTAQWILAQRPLAAPGKALDALLDLACDDPRHDSRAWGLGFPWMSKNGLYGSETPFVTHTPYVLEALLHIARSARDETVAERAMATFVASRGFFDRLRVMFEDPERLALSYAPVDEPRIVINANSYAAFSLALYCQAGVGRRDDPATVERICRWIVSEQRGEGCWPYYADGRPGNFIDTFHSCFVIKNLLRTAELMPGVASLVTPAIESGVGYLEDRMLDRKHGLMRRFAERDLRDPFVWDLYDQAEYLGVLVHLGRLDEAVEFARRVRGRFHHRGHWYCRIDVLGRRWGRDFLRWGIVPFLYHERRLDQALLGREEG